MTDDDYELYMTRRGEWRLSARARAVCWPCVEAAGPKYYDRASAQRSSTQSKTFSRVPLMYQVSCCSTAPFDSNMSLSVHCSGTLMKQSFVGTGCRSQAVLPVGILLAHKR